MPGNFRKEDLRKAKTYKSLIDAMFDSLARRNFSQITVNEICEFAQVSRTTFYAHFVDKYHLLTICLDSCIQNNSDPYIQINNTICELVINKRKAIINILEDTNSETHEVVFEFMLKMLNRVECKKDAKSAQYGVKREMILSFCAGGMVNYLQSQARGKADEAQMHNSSFNRLLEYVFNWDNS